MGFTAKPGTISHGTLRDQDLIPAFRDHLEFLISQDRDIERRAQANAFLTNLANRMILMGDFYYSSEYVVDDIGELQEKLDEYSPEGYSFGAHEGDGSDFGYWPVD